MQTGKSAYSLVEILVVLAILSLLAALLIPVFTQARAKARQTACASNLQQISRGLSLYASDYDAAYPPIFQDAHSSAKTLEKSVMWLDLLLPYTKMPMRCPDVILTDKMEADLKKHSTLASSFSGYAINTFLSQTTHLHDRKPVGKADTQIPYPSLTIAVFDVRAGISASSRPDGRWWYFIDPSVEKRPGFYMNGYIEEIGKQKEGATRHNGGANYAFADGHVKWFKPQQLSDKIQNDGLHPGFGL